MTRLNAASVREEVCRAFAEVPYPGNDRLVEDPDGDNLEAQQVAAHFRGASWRDIDLDFIRRYDENADASACLSFMTPDAFRYYLPAFLLLVLDHYDAAGLIIDTTVSKLAPWPDSSDQAMANFVQQRLSGFTGPQRRAVASFLEYLLQEHAGDVSPADLDRAIRYWS